MNEQADKLREMIAASMWVGTLTPEERKRVESEIVTRTVAKGDFVCRKDQPAEDWIGIVDGLVKLTVQRPSGKMTTYTAMPTGGWFGEASLQRNVPRSYDAVALRDSLIAYMPRATFVWLLDHNIHFNHFVLRLLAARLFQFFSLLEYDRLLLSTSRVAHCLATLFDPWLHPGIGNEIEISQEEIGNLVGLSRQWVNQALKDLKDAGLLKVEHRSITVLDVEGLRQFREVEPKTPQRHAKPASKPARKSRKG
jgi:CRP/FNR family transcriptional regulator, cyclic AMP receptor protein